MSDTVMRTDRLLLAFSLLASAWFGFIVLYNVLRLDWAVAGALVELFTIPLILAVAAVAVFAVGRLLLNPLLKRPPVNASNIASALILLALNGLVWGL